MNQWYIDCKGQIVVAPIFKRVEDFSGGLGKITVGVDRHSLIGFIEGMA